MAIHSKQEIISSLDDRVSGTSALLHPLPKYKFPGQQTDATAAYQLVHDELLLDGNSRQNLATFCQTWVEPEVRKLMDECIDKNMVDKDEYPQTAEIESRCIHMLADLWNAPGNAPGNSPDAANTQGCSTTGSSEAAMLSGLAMKTRWRKKRQGAGRAANKPNLICGPVQVCWHKFGRYFDVELRQIPCQGQRLHMSPEEVIQALRRHHHLERRFHRRIGRGMARPHLRYGRHRGRGWRVRGAAAPGLAAPRGASGVYRPVAGAPAVGGRPVRYGRMVGGRCTCPTCGAGPGGQATPAYCRCCGQVLR